VDSTPAHSHLVSDIPGWRLAGKFSLPTVELGRLVGAQGVVLLGLDSPIGG